MGASIVFTLTGADRVGIVEDVTRVFLELGGNVGTSRMTRLDGEFAMLMSVTLRDPDASPVEQAFARLVSQGYRVTVAPARPAVSGAFDGWTPYFVSVTGADHEGIVHEIAAGLSRSGITIESMETGTAAAAVTGTPLFTMQAHVLVPPTLEESEWISELDEAGRSVGVDIEVTAEG